MKLPRVIGNDINENDNFVRWLTVNMPNITAEDKNKIYQAYILAVSSHGLICRRDGTSVMIHVEATAKRLHRWGFNIDFFIAGLLHDIIEDCAHIKIEYIKKEFGDEVADMVNFMSKNINYGILSYELKVDHFLKKNPNYVFIRLADQFHNVSNPSYSSYDSFIINCREIKWNIEFAISILSSYENINNNLKADLYAFSQIIEDYLKAKS